MSHLKSYKKQFLRSVSMSQEELAKRCGLDVRTIGRWVAGDEVAKDTRERICDALMVKDGFFERPEKVPGLFRSSWQALDEQAPAFGKKLHEIASLQDEALFERLCVDLSDHRGAQIVRPATRTLSTTVQSLDELGAVESFLGYGLLMLLSPYHPLAVHDDGAQTTLAMNVDGTQPMRFRGVSCDVVPRMLVDFRYAPGTRDRLPVVDDGTLKPSPHSVALRVLGAAEESAVSGCDAFVAELVSRLDVATALKLRADVEAGSEDAFSKAMFEKVSALSPEDRGRLFEELNDEIELRNYSNDHVIAIASAETPTSWAEQLKADYLPNLRVACLRDVTAMPRDVLHCSENQLITLARSLTVEIEKRRVSLGASSVGDVSSGSPMNLYVDCNNASIQAGNNNRQLNEQRSGSESASSHLLTHKSKNLFFIKGLEFWRGVSERLLRFQ